MMRRWTAGISRRLRTVGASSALLGGRFLPSQIRGDLAEAVLETTGALVLVCGRDGRTLRANPALQRFTGRSTGELIGKPFWEIVVIPEEVQLARRAVADVLAGGETIPAEVDWLAVGGERRRVELQTSVLADAHGLAYAVAFIGVDVTVHRRREARFEQQAMTDALTGVANRGMLFSLLRRCLDRISGTGSGLLFCDLDGFKGINDTWGHAAGDRLLIAVAERLREVAGDHGVVARLGGDEFVVLYPGIGRTLLDEKAGELELIMQRPFEVDGLRLDVGVSVGAAVGAPGADADALMTEADIAMYGEKRMRRRRAHAGRVEVSSR